MDRRKRNHYVKYILQQYNLWYNGSGKKWRKWILQPNLQCNQSRFQAKIQWKTSHDLDSLGHFCLLQFRLRRYRRITSLPIRQVRIQLGPKRVHYILIRLQRVLLDRIVDTFTLCLADFKAA